MKNQMYLVRFKKDDNHFIGWNSVYGCSLPDAKKKLLSKVGKQMYDRIDWSTLKKGREAEAIDCTLEKQYSGLFD